MIHKVRLAVEQSPNGTMIHLIDMPGAFTRGESLDIAVNKVIGEAQMYERWTGEFRNQTNYQLETVQVENTNAQICDGDTEILTIKDTASDSAYMQTLKQLAIKSAQDFQILYDSVPNKEFNDITKNRATFYGKVPSNAKEILVHVDEVAGYYLSRIDIGFTEDKNDLVFNRCKGIEVIEKSDKYLSNQILYKDKEYWTTAKVLRRFIWHDRIHARALYRFAVKTWGDVKIANAFNFLL